MKRLYRSPPIPLAALSVLLAAGAAAGAGSSYRLAVPPYRFSFPRDHAAHPDFRTEWWYYTGHLRAGGRELGYQLTFFRVGLDPERARSRSRWAPHTAYFAHLALTDLGAQRFRYAEQAGRPALGMAGARSDRYETWIDEWSARLDADGRTHRLRAERGDWGVELSLVPLKPPVVHGQDGVSRKAEGRGRASHYYSLTRLRTRGMLLLDGRRLPVEGESWMDHEFGSSQLGPEQQGWDWFSIQLDTGRDCMLYLMRRRDGTVEPVSSGTIVDADGGYRHLTRPAFEVTPLGRWRSPASGATYPHGWRIRIPGERLELELQPALADQELRTASSTGVTYWEGSVGITGTDRGLRTQGRGYVELTGYAGRVPGV